MYRRYTQGRGEGVSVSRMRHNRLRDILILVLVIALAVLAWFAVPAIRDNNARKSTMITQLQNECNEAVEIAQKQLSRTAGTDSYYSLAMIRSDLHAIQSLNDAYIKAYNSKLIPDELNDQINWILSVIRQYYDIVQAGTDTGLIVTNLLTSLNELKQGLDNLN